MCDGPTLKVGEQYLMYTRRDPDGGIAVRGCTRSRHVKFAEGDVKYLDGLDDAEPTVRIFGRIDSWPEGPGDKTPLPGAAVTLVGPDETRTAKADDKGQYSFQGLKPGKYRVSASLAGFDKPLCDYGCEADVEARGCAAMDVTLRKLWPGRIAGRLIRFDGTPASAGIDLMLIRVTEDGEAVQFGNEVLTNEQGEYEFRGLQAGKYKVVLHWWRYPTPEAPYPAIYWPAASNAEGASEIVVDDDGSSQKYDFRLPREYRTAVAKGIVLLPGGKPAPGVEVTIVGLPSAGANEREACCDFLDRALTDENGRFTFKAVEGINYGLTANEVGEPLRSTIFPLSFYKARELIVLLMDVTKDAKDRP